MRMRACVTMAVAPLLAGCVPGAETGFDSVDGQARTRALVGAARTEDQTAIPELIELLDSADSAERMLAIRTLERMTGKTLGYDHAAERWEREIAVARWVEWWREQEREDL